MSLIGILLNIIFCTNLRAEEVSDERAARLRGQVSDQAAALAAGKVSEQAAARLTSPDQRIQVLIEPGKSFDQLLTYSVRVGEVQILQSATLGISIAEPDQSALVVIKTERRSKNSSWATVYGERAMVPEQYNELEIELNDAKKSSCKVVLLIRAYNEGLAYQYQITKAGAPILLTAESSVFPVPGKSIAWVSSRAQSPLKATSIADIKELSDRPVTIKAGNALFLAIGEAALVDFARMKFEGSSNGSLNGRITDTVSFKDKMVSPWRYMLIGKSPGELLEKNYLLLNLNEPNKIADVSWIRPGKIIRESSLTTQGAINCINFAATHGLSYISFDAGWYGREDSDTSDATRVALDPARSKGPLDLQKVIAYGRSKNIGIILYVNRRALERQLDTLLPLYQSWGISGIKFGFVQVGNQQWTNWLHEAVRKCAKYKMVVDIHDEYRPTGYSRTYPNLLTQEGIRGDEESPFTEHSITTIFTRMIAGAADNTNCYFTNRVFKMGSRAAQMAKSGCIYSPLQFLYWYDRPVADSLRRNIEGEITEIPELRWFDKLPVVWDETRVLESDMEAFATIARRKGSEWFIGSLNGASSRKLSLSLSFLPKNKKFNVITYTDNPDSPSKEKIIIRSQALNSTSTLNFEMMPRTGVAISIHPI